MADVIISPNMSLPIPIVGVDPGPDWANNINACLGILDQHNHSPGRGVQINPNGLDINTDLPMNGNNLTLVKTVNFLSQLTSLPGATPNLGCIYVAGNELYYNDESGNVIAITHLGSVNSGGGSISGLPSGSASASYNSFNQTFVWQSATLTPANLDAGSIILRNVTSGSKGVTLSPVSGLGADYNLILPTLPLANTLLALDSSGNITANMTSALADSVGSVMTATGANNIFSVVSSASTISSTVANQISNNRTKTLSGTVGNVAGSVINVNFTTTSSGFVPVTNLTCTLTTNGRPVMIIIQPIQQTASGFISVTSTGSADSCTVILENNLVYWYTALNVNAGEESVYPGPGLNTIDTSVIGTPGTYTYSVAVSTGGNSSISFNNLQMFAYEL